MALAGPIGEHSTGRRVGDTPTAEGDVIQVPSALRPEEPRQERAAVRRHQGAVLAGSLSSSGTSGLHLTCFLLLE